MQYVGLFLLSVACAFAEDDAADFFEDSAVKSLTGEDWEAHLEQNPKSLVMFYAPWCGHCKNIKPDFSAAAKEMGFASLAGVDCTAEANKDVCSQYDVKGYPTIKWFENGEATDFDGGREKQGIINFVTSKGGNDIGDLSEVDFKKMRVKNLKKILTDRGVNIKGMTDKSEFVKAAEENRDTAVVAPKKKKFKGTSLKNGMTVAQERRWKARKEAADEGFGTEEGANGEVIHLIEEDWEAARKTHPKMLVMFYAPWCGHCKSLKPLYVEASLRAKETDPDVKIVAVECVTNPELCRKFGAMSYPTLKVFTDESEPVDYTGARDADGFAEHILKTFRPEDFVEKPFENDVTKWEENGAVIHMKDSHWATFRAENPKILAVFYAPWCGHCKAMKPDFATVSAEFEGKLPFVAVDCDVEKGLCGQFDVKGFPTMKYFDTSDGEAEDYDGGRDADNFRTFAEDKAGSTAEAAEDEEEVDDEEAVEDKKEL